MRIHSLRAGRRAAVTLSLLYLAGCATSPAPVTETFPSSTADAESRSGVKHALYQQHDRWRGTRYRVGGLDGDGFDCSGLTYVLYRDLFGKHLPRTTGEQAEVGRSVNRGRLGPGDLVFFKTGVFQKHVGIYVENGLFLHASRSGGVRLSDLEKGYWRKRYWQARRLSGI